jgi:uncharacterized protein DUF6572
MKLCTVVAICSLTWASYAFGGGLNDGDVVDRVLIHPKTGQALLVMSVDLPLTEEANEEKLSHKVSTYVAFVESGQLHAKYPQAKPNVPILLSFVFELPPPSNVVQKLRGMKERLIDRGYEVQIKIYDEKLKKLVDLEP